MKKSLVYCFIALMATCVATPLMAAESVVTSRTASIDLGAMPLVSRSLAEFGADEPVSDALARDSDAGYGYSGENEGPAWLFASLIEPFYLTLIGAALLVLGTFKGRKNT